MPGMKRSEQFSIVPEGLRRRFRESQQMPEAKNMPMQKGDNIPMSDKQILRNMIQEEKKDMMEDRMEGEGYAKGGMVRKGYAKGGMVKVRGYGKARSKPCKIC